MSDLRFVLESALSKWTYPVGEENNAQIFTVKADTRKGIEKKGQKMLTVFWHEYTSKRLRRQTHTVKLSIKLREYS